MIFLLSDHPEHRDQHQPQHHRRHKGRQKNILIGHEGRCTVIIDDGFSIAQHGSADIRTHNAGNEHLAEDPQTLEHTGPVLGGIVTDHGAKNRHARQIATHHQQGTNEHQGGVAEEIEDHIAAHQQGNRRDHHGLEAVLVIYLAVEGGKNSRQNDGRRHDQNIVVHPQGYIVIKDQIRHVHLDGNIEHGKSQEGNVQQLIALDHTGPETVKDIGKVVGILLFLYGLVFNEEDSQHTDGNDSNADDVEDQRPASALIQIKAHKTAENHQNCHQRHHGIDSLRSAPVGGIRGFGEPGVEAGIIGGGAEEGHHAVQDDHQADAHRRSGSRCREQGIDHIHADQRETPDTDAPDDIAAANEQLALTDLIGQSADEQRCYSSRRGGGRHHGGDGFGGGVEHLIDEHVEVHILHYPSYLSGETEDHQRQPEAAGLFRCFHKNQHLPNLFVWLFYHFRLSLSRMRPVPGKSRRMMAASIISHDYFLNYFIIYLFKTQFV